MLQNLTIDEQWMEQALALAHRAAAVNEVPVGAVLVHKGSLIGSGYNQTIGLQRPSAHAEIQALENASLRFGIHAVAGSTLYVTLEPCLMCLGAIVATRIRRIVFGTYEPNTGALVSHYQLADYPGHQFDWCAGVLQSQCAALLQQFFRDKRQVSPHTS